MGPACPECATVFPWTAGELEEVALGPRVYVCGGCGVLFVLDPDDVAALQVRLRAPEPEPEPSPAPALAAELLETTPILDLALERDPNETELEVAARALDLGVRLSEIAQRLYEKLARMSGERVSNEDYRRLFDIEQRTWRDAVSKGTQSVAYLSRAPDGLETERLRLRARELLDLSRAHLRPV